MAEEVVRTLLGRLPPHSPAVIKGYKRFSIVGRQYPAIIPVAGSQVKGKVMFDLSQAELQMLDLFEDEEYIREVVQALASADEEGIPPDALHSLPCEAGVYVWANRVDPALQGDWDYDAWRAKYLQDYVEMCKGFPDDGEGMELRLQLERENAAKGL